MELKQQRINDKLIIVLAQEKEKRPIFYSIYSKKEMVAELGNLEVLRQLTGRTEDSVIMQYTGYSRVSSMMPQLMFVLVIVTGLLIGKQCK